MSIVLKRKEEGRKVRHTMFHVDKEAIEEYVALTYGEGA